MEVFEVSSKNNNWSKKRLNTSVNPQGLSEDEVDQAPKSQLEQRAKKKNTKI
ncbi:small, acid-soluble spore protein L [Oceanobacillus zhaokaii]|jgi:small acid-soluble spore protein L (minor)|uniref:Small, acid-soluble spore protein L n=1 Tax=Oceanobacillus zhaokaii TaxID=2052660 RepID=A0A345PF48_9BACI|nr:small, acid-soluble spore protein L [Oceanobacillus zhaokaii]